MKYLISLNFKHLSMKMNWEKWISHWGKWNFEPIGNSKHTTEYLSLGKALLARLYLKIKVYTNSLIVHNLLYLRWNNFVWIFFIFLPLVNIQWTFSPFSFPWWLTGGYIFYYMSLFLQKIDDEKEEKIKSSSIFEEFYFKLRRKFWKFIKTVDSG